MRSQTRSAVRPADEVPACRDRRRPLSVGQGEDVPLLCDVAGGLAAGQR
jgi:hypothetical protein